MPVPFYNNSGEVIPPYAVMEVEDGYDATSRTIVKVTKPTGSDNEAGYLLNGPVEVPIGKTGTGFTAHEPSWAYYSTGDTPENSQEWGPEEDEWWLKSGEPGFRIVGGADSAAERVLVRVIGGGGTVKVIGPCATYTPDVADPDTDFETEYPGGCDGPDKVGINIKNVETNVVTIEPATLESTGPLKLSTDVFSLACVDTSVNVYIEIVFFSLTTSSWNDSADTPVDGVVATIFRSADDSVLATYRNTIYSWYPMAGGNLQLGPEASPCECGTLPFDLCLSIPNR